MRGKLVSLGLGASLLAAACSSAGAPVSKDPVDSGESVALAEGADAATPEPDAGAGQDVLSQSTLVDLLGRIPLAAYESSAESSGSVEVHLTDIAAASELVGLDRPDSADLEAGLDWLVELTTFDTDESGYLVAAPTFPERNAAGQSEAIAAEIGFSVLDINTSATLTAHPIFFAAVEGETLRLSPDLIELGGGVVTAGEGEDFVQYFETGTVARPFGRPLRMATDGDVVVASVSTPLVEAWLANGPSMLDVESFALVASALDSAGSLSAYIVRSDFQNLDFLLDEQSERPAVVTARFDTVGIGSVLVDGRGASVVAYVFADEASAAASVPELTVLWSSAPLNGSEATMADYFEVRSVEQQGRVVLVVARVAEGQTTNRALDLLFRSELVFTSS